MNPQFQDFLRTRWRQKLAAHRVLSIYDADGRYADVAAALANESTRVLAVGADIITAREDALEALVSLADDPNNATNLVLYQQRPRPVDDAGWLDDPFAPVALAGAVFPDGPADDYKSLCQQFLPERAAELEELFAAGEPSFAVVNHLTEGAASYPTLSEILQADGAKDILVKFLSPAPEQRKRLARSKAWTRELEALATRTLGFALSAKGVDQEELRLTLWRFLLFSEFAADLPVPVPTALTNVPKAAPRHGAFVYGVCETLRDSKTAEQTYEDFANRVADQLQLPLHCREIDDLGVRDTFAFEERSFLRRFTKLVLEGPADEAAAVADARRNSFWIRDSRRAAEWKLAGCCLDFLRRLQAARPAINGKPGRSVAEWVQVYVAEVAIVDALYRQVEEVAAEIVPLESPLLDVVSKVRSAYVEAINDLARPFQQAVQREGWPASGLPRATEIFERFVQQPWQAGQRVAFFWVDALRYDLGLLLQELTGTRHAVNVTPACAQLPTFTRVGMAALLPGADTGLRVLKRPDGVAVAIHGEVLSNPEQRFQLVQRLVGVERCRLLDLDDLITAKTPADLGPAELLVVKTTDIDSLGESNPGYVIGLIPEVVRKLQLALNRLADAGFQVAVLTGDHGFLWLAEPSASDAVAKPAGDWIEAKDRCLLGAGQPSANTLLLETAHLGIRGDVPHYVTPRGMATFNRGVRYCHQGLSPQECVLPLVTVQLRAAAPRKVGAKTDLHLAYRGERKAKVHILQPSIEVAYFGGDLFGPAEVRFRLEAFDAKGARVAQAAASPVVNIETREATVLRGQALKVPIRIQEGAAGKLEVRASNAETGEIYGTMILETDFHL